MLGFGLFNSTVAWKIMAHFFEHPSDEEHVNALARKLRVSASSVSTSCKNLLAEGLLNKIERGNSLFYSLNNNSPLVRNLKKTWFLHRLLQFKSEWQHDEFVSFALYGSYASGDFVEKSDVDLLAITNMDFRKVLGVLAKTREKLGPEVTITVFPLSEWLKKAEKHDRFYIEVLSSHVLLWGSSLVVG